MDIRENEIKKELLDKKSILLSNHSLDDKIRCATESTIHIIDWIIETLCDGKYVILEKDKLNFSFDINNNKYLFGSTITMNVAAGQINYHYMGKKDELNKEMKEMIKKHLIERWLHDNTL